MKLACTSFVKTLHVHRNETSFHSTCLQYRYQCDDDETGSAARNISSSTTFTDVLVNVKNIEWSYNLDCCFPKKLEHFTISASREMTQLSWETQNIVDPTND